QPHPGVAAEAVEVAPDDVAHVDPALHDAVLDKPAQVVDRQGRDHGRAAIPAFAHGEGGILFVAAFPDLELTGIAHPAETRIEAQHKLAEGGAIPAGLAGRADVEHRFGHVRPPFEWRRWSGRSGAPAPRVRPSPWPRS